MKNTARMILSVLMLGATVSVAQDCERQADTFTYEQGYFIYGTATLSETAGMMNLGLSGDFSTTPGPDLYLYLAIKNEAPTSPGNDHLEVAKLASDMGMQDYSIPDSVAIDDYDYVLIHCKQYNHFWGGGLLSPPTGSACMVSMPDSEMDSDLAVQVRPNPFRGSAQATIEGIAGMPTEVYIHDLQGRLLEQKIMNEPTSFVLGEYQEPGCYLVTVRQGNRQRTERFIKLKL